MPLVLLVTGTTTLVVVAGLFKLLRRRAPVLTDQDLDAIPGVPSNVRVIKSLGENEREALKEAFLKGSDFQWMATGDDFAKIDFFDKKNPTEKQQEAQKKHKALTYYMLECVLRFADLYAHTFVLTENPRSDPNPGKILGALTLVPPYPSHRLFSVHFFRAVIPLGIPVTEKMGGGAKERFDAYTDQTVHHHDQVMHDTPHWYVVTLGVFKNAQGKGAGKTLLQAAKAMAGENPLYLECHNDNVAFYKKMGYRHARQYNFDVKADKDNTSTMPYSYNSMVRDGNQ